MKGYTQSVTVRLSKPAPVGGVTVLLTSSNVSKAAISPASVFIPAGQTSSPTVASLLGIELGTAEIQLASPGLSAGQIAVTITAPVSLRFLNYSGGAEIVVGKGLTTSAGGYIYVERVVGTTAFSGTDAVTVTLSCASTAICTTPATVTIPAGQSNVYQGVDINGIDIGTSTVNASAPGYLDGAYPVRVVLPELRVSGLGASYIVGSQPTAYAYFYTAGASGGRGRHHCRPTPSRCST